MISDDDDGDGDDVSDYGSDDAEGGGEVHDGNPNRMVG